MKKANSWCCFVPIILVVCTILTLALIVGSAVKGNHFHVHSLVPVYFYEPVYETIEHPAVIVDSRVVNESWTEKVVLTYNKVSFGYYECIDCGMNIPPLHLNH